VERIVQLDRCNIGARHDKFLGGSNFLLKLISNAT